PEIPESIRTDELRLKQVLRNLLSNAFKFTDRGSIKVTIDLADGQPPSDYPWISFEVADTGIGIPKDKQRVIFEAFQQVDGGSNRRYGGTGLGLSISREIAGLLGGRLSVSSAPGSGSRFTLTIPGVLQAAALTPPQSQPQSRSYTPLPPSAMPVETPIARRLIADDRDALRSSDRVCLIIEDDATFAEILLEAAREMSFKGVVCPTGEEALSLAV